MQPSGTYWVDQFPTSNKIDDLSSHFKSRVIRFLDSIVTAGAQVTVTATLRPPQRAYLMHYSWCIAKQWKGIDPAKVPAYQPRQGETAVDIQWLHNTPAGLPDIGATTKGAKEMVRGFGIAHLGVPPALNSLHIRGEAIDMLISWQGTLVAKDAHGKSVVIDSVPRDGTNADLIKLGGSFGVIHLIHVQKDPPHWSINGH
jgi:hypothetical protein